MGDFDEREFNKTNKKLYLGNLPGQYQGGPKQQKEAARLYVENLCQRYGQPTDILVNVDKRFAFVTFPTKEAAQYAIYHLAETNVGGSTLHVSWSKPSKEQLAQRDAARKAEQAFYEKKDEKKEATPAAEGQAKAKEPKAQKEKQEKAPVAEKPQAVAVEEKPEPVRFSAQQKPQQQKKPQPVNVKAQPQAKPAQTKAPAAKPAEKAPAPQRFKVTVQNETTPGLPTVTLSISFEEWNKYICPLISNNAAQSTVSN